MFSKYIPNLVRLDTVRDAANNEIAVEIREDSDAALCRKKSFDLLLSGK